MELRHRVTPSCCRSSNNKGFKASTYRDPGAIYSPTGPCKQQCLVGTVMAKNPFLARVFRTCEEVPARQNEEEPTRFGDTETINCFFTTLPQPASALAFPTPLIRKPAAQPRLSLPGRDKSASISHGSAFPSHPHRPLPSRCQSTTGNRKPAAQPWFPPLDNQPHMCVLHSRSRQQCDHARLGFSQPSSLAFPSHPNQTGGIR
jgi:hypothetical protein